MRKVTCFLRSKVISGILFFCFILITNELHAQKKKHDHTHTLRINCHAMYSLVGWGALNSISGTLLLQKNQFSEKPRTLSFLMSNIAWGLINSGIGVLGLVQTNKARSLSSHADITSYSSRLKRTYLVNAGLDILYLVTGAYLSGRKDNPELQGLGRSILVQPGLFTRIFLNYKPNILLNNDEKCFNKSILSELTPTKLRFRRPKGQNMH